MDNESEVVAKFLSLKKDLDAVGLTVIARNSRFEIADCKEANGVILLPDTNSLENFTDAYILGFKASRN